METRGSPEHAAFVALIRADPDGLGTKMGQLYDVSYVRPCYHYRHTTGVCYEFCWRFHTECGKDRCISAAHEMSLKELVDAMDKDDTY